MKDRQKKAQATVDYLVALKKELCEEQDFESASKVRDVENLIRSRFEAEQIDIR